MKKNNSLMRQFWVSVVGYLLLLFFCFDSLNSCCLLSFVPVVPIKSYYNVETNKSTILEENKQKSGIYRWINKVNNKKYVGSAGIFQIDYYSPAKMNFVVQQSKSLIYSAIIKYGLKDFTLEILEYCEPDKLLIREKYYIDFGSEYNILKDPILPPMSGRSHSDESKTKISDALAGEKNPMYDKNHSDESKQIMSDAKKGQPKVEGSGKPSQVIEVTDSELNITTLYNSFNEAARALNLPSYRIIANYIKNNQTKPYKGRYIFKKI
jgi:group I intron endonuclease